MKTIVPCDPPSGREGPRKAQNCPESNYDPKKSCLRKIGKVIFRCLNSGEKFS